MKANLVTVKTFDDSISARIVMNRLESEGIACFLHDEHIVSLNPLYNFAVGGVKLKVSEADAKQALIILEEIENSPYTDDNGVIRCPNCESSELYAGFKSMKNPAGILAAITSFLLSVFPIYYFPVYRCKKCDTEFRIKR